MGQLFGGLYTFGYHTQVKGFGESYDGVDDGCVFGIAPKPIYERAIELERINRIALEVAQGRIAGAEVIYRQSQAKSFQFLEGAKSWPCAVQRHAFRNL